MRPPPGPDADVVCADADGHTPSDIEAGGWRACARDWHMTLGCAAVHRAGTAAQPDRLTM